MLRSLPAWASLQQHYERMKGLQLRQLFAEDSKRGERLAVEGAGIYLDYSKNRITGETLGLLIRLAREAKLHEHVEAMFRGDLINVSENRAVLHVALRMPRGATIMHDGRNVVINRHGNSIPSFSRSSQGSGIPLTCANQVGMPFCFCTSQR